MKKRKPPIVLGTLLAVMLGVAIVPSLSQMSSKTNDEHAHNDKQDGQTPAGVGEPRAPVTAESLAKQAKENMVNTGATPIGASGAGHARSQYLSIEIPPKYIKVKPGSQEVQTQWWDERTPERLVRKN